MSGAVVAAARATLGAPFRLHGRDPAAGLDCVGLVALALRAGGYAGPVPQGYRLRTGRAVLPDLPGLRRCDGAQPGDVLLCRAGAGQLHLALRSGRGVIHADAALRRVVERPGEVPWPIVAAWRLQSGGA